MFTPFAPFDTRLLAALTRHNRLYFVRQHYAPSCGAAPSNNHEFIITHYPDIAFAQEHFGAIEHDTYRFLYNWNNPEHQARLKIAASQPEGYTIWSALFRPDWQQLITKEMEQRMRHYIEAIGWKPRRSDLVNPQYYLHYGHLYVQLKCNRKEVRVKFDEIETLF